MNIGQALQLFRKNRGLKQREVLHHYNSSVYSKIESEKRELRLSDLVNILEQLAITSEEFFSFSGIDREQEEFRKLYKECRENLNDADKKAQLLRADFDWAERKGKTLREISNYVAIHVVFSTLWEDVAPLSKAELDDLFNLLSSKDCFFQYDYIIITNIIFLLEEKQIDILMNKALPVKNEDLRNRQIKEFIKCIVNNAITKSLYLKNYEKAQYYFELAKSQQHFLPDVDYSILMTYLENLIQYLMTGRYQFINKVYHCINFLYTIDQKEWAKNIEIEVESLTLNKEYPITSMINILVRDARK